MDESIAVVFDSAGTLLHMYRVAKDTITGKYIDDIITTDLVSKKPNCGLVIMHTDPVQAAPSLSMTQYNVSRMIPGPACRTFMM